MRVLFMRSKLWLLLSIWAAGIVIANSNLRASDVAAVLKSPSLVYRLDAVTGAFRGSIQVSNGISVGCDGETIAVLLGNGFVNRYEAKSGAYRGALQVGDKPQSVQVSGGVISVRTASYLKRYRATDGVYLGSTQI
jgi:hypothetical protein